MVADRDLGGRFRLWVHCPDLLESQLTEYFSQYGTVTDFYCPRDRHNGTRKNFGFATFETEEGLRRTLAAGAEHVISGKTVRVNLAGPRPELPLLYMDPSQTQPMLLTQITGGSLGEQSPLRGQSSLQSSALPASRGSGPRIYVGGIPTAVSETMIRQHFSQWGQVTDCYFPRDKYLNRRKNFCFVTFATQQTIYTVQAAEKAAAQSDREINGYRIESISVTHDRHTHYQRQAVTPSQSQIPSYNSAPTPGVRDGSITGGMRWMGSARGAHNTGGNADTGLVTSVSALTNTMAGMDLTGISPFRNANFMPTVPLQHDAYGQTPGAQNVYLDDVGQGNVTDHNTMDVMFGTELPHMSLMGLATSAFMEPGLEYTLGYSQGQHAGAYGRLHAGDASRLEAASYRKPAVNFQSMPMAYHQSSGSLGTSPGAPHVPLAAKQNLLPSDRNVQAAGSLAHTATTTSTYHPAAVRSSAVSGV